MNEILKELLKRPIAYHPIVAKAFDSVTLAILWSQLFYWSDKTNDPDGWIYKTRYEIFDETGLSRKQQETARKIGVDLEVLIEQRIGKLGVMHFKIDFEKSEEIIDNYIKKNSGKKEMRLFGDEPAGKKVSQISYLQTPPESDILEMMQKFGKTREFVLARATDVVDYCEAKGKRYSNYKAAWRNFIKNHRQEKSVGNVGEQSNGKYSNYGPKSAKQS